MAEIIAEGTATWANSAAAGTEQNIDITDVRGGNSVIVVHNPSTVTALTVSVRDVETLNAAARYAQRTSFSVAANSDGSFAVENWPVGNARLVLSNDTALGLTDGFTAHVRVRRR